MPDNKLAPLQHRPLEEHVRKVALVFNDHVTTQNPHPAYVAAGHAGLYLSVPGGTATITPTPQKVTGFDTQKLPEIDASSSLTNSTITFNQPGFWVVMFKLVIETTSSSANTSREVQIDLWNETQGVKGVTQEFGALARYQSVLSLDTSVMFPVSASVGNEYALYASSPSGDTIAVNIMQLMEFDVFRVSNFGEVPAPRGNS